MKRSKLGSTLTALGPFLILAFVSIGLEVTVKTRRDAGWKPIGVFGAATAFNAVVALILASLLFRGFVV